MYDFSYNGIKGSKLKIFALEYPRIPAPKKVYKEYDIPGKNGVYLQDLKKYEQTEISVPLNYIGPIKYWGERWREAKKWLSVKNTELVFSDDPNVFYRISKVDIGENQKKAMRVGAFEATFTTKDGLTYLRHGKVEYEIKDVTENQYIECCPRYRVSGKGIFSIMVNGCILKIPCDGEIIIDTERELVFKNGEIINNTSSGDLSGLVLLPGKNDIRVSPGFDVKVTPNWRCL